MLSYEEALERILSAAEPLPTESVTVFDAAGRAIAENLSAPENLPPFDNSAVDGYAVHSQDLRGLPGNTVVLPVRQTITAGVAPLPPLTPGNVARIMTGAPVPAWADTIVMQEDTESHDRETVGFLDSGSAKYIRRAGSDVRQGEAIARPGNSVDAGLVGLLCSLGVTTVPCHARPRIGILSTGDELVPVDTQTLPPAKIRNSNGPALAAAVALAGGIVAAQRHAVDDPDAIRTALQSLSGCDVVISSGGVSVGGADYVKEIVSEIGTLDFWRIAIKPGKPLAFGTVGDALFFGLPGNPVSSLVTFELFVRPVLRSLAGHRNTGRPQITATLTAPLSHEPGRREFVRARLEYRDGEAFATPTGAQGSHRISSLVGADALIIAHEDREDYAAGERLAALLLS